MFGNNKPFGTATAFGSNTAFGVKPPGSNVFGTPSFGNSAPSTGGLFGSTTPSTGAGLFGAATSSFGQPASTSGSTFGFGSTSTSGGLFGSTTQQTPSTGLFGGSNTSAFGAPRPTFGTFGSTSTGTSLFGQPQQQQTTSLFGQSSSSGTGLFGSTGTFGTTTTGTTIKFNPPTGSDTMMKSGVSTNINTRHQCITCMKEYENKSLEELRMEDYLANRKGPQSGIGAFGQTGQSGLFGTPTTTSAFSFGTSQNKPLFGSSTGNTFGSTGTSLFGQNTQQQSTGLFGKPVTFGTPTTSTGTTFFGSSGGTSLFGQNNQQKPLFGQPASTGLFGSTTTAQPSTVFGTGSVFGNTFNTGTQGGLFGTKPTGFGTTNTTSTNTFTFGNATANTTDLFGQKPAFGTGAGLGATTSGFGGFSSTQNTSSGLFGQTKPTAGFSTGAGSTFGTGLGSFNTPGFTSGLNTNTGSSLFGSTAAKPTGFFGTSGVCGLPAFGQTGLNQALNFGPSASVGLGSDPNNAVQVHVQQQILALTTSPFGDSPLFRNIIKDSNKREEVLKPTNPTAQKALITSSQYKVSSLPTAKIKPKPIQPVPNGKISLFDGLEDEEPSLGSEIFVPRRSVKKLVLKQKSPPENSQLSLGNMPSHQTINTLKNISAEKVLPVQEKTSPPIMPLTIDISESNVVSSQDAVSPGPSNHESISDAPIDHCYTNPVAKPIPEHPTKGLNTTFDDTIDALHTRAPRKTGRALGVMNTSDCDESEKDISHNSTTGGEGTQNGDICQENFDTPHPAGIILKRPGYYTIPSLEELALMIDENGRCVVENFTIGREGYGNVFFPGTTNVSGLNVDEIVHFRRKEITIYPDDDNKPPIGEGLNKKAQVTLDCVWPNDKTTHAAIKDPDRLKLMGYQEKIERATAKLKAKFIDYRPETGSWVFMVQHFSKYGLEESDEECEDPKYLSEFSKEKAAQSSEATSIQQGLQVVNGHEPLTSLKPMPVQPLPSSASPSDDDDEMEDITSQNVHKDIVKDANFSTGDVYSPSCRLALALGVDAQRVQGMKMSFFQEDDMEEDGEFEVREMSQMTPLNTGYHIEKPVAKKLATGERSVPRHKQVMTVGRTCSPFPVIKMGHHVVEDMSSVTSSRSELFSHYPVVQSTLPEKSAPHVHSCILDTHRRPTQKKFIKSLLYNKHRMIADAGCFMGCSSRPGWGPNWTVAHVSNPIGSVSVQKGMKKITAYDLLSPSLPSQKDAASFTVTVEVVKMSSFVPVNNVLKKNLEESLNVHLSHSASTLEEGCPIFVPTPGIAPLHAHAACSRKQLSNAEPTHHDAAFLKQTNHVLELCVALWGDIPGYDKDTDGPSTYSHQMARKEALSKWLISTTRERIQEEIQNEKFHGSGYLSTIFSHLTGQQITEACVLAQQSKDHRLALLLSQAGSNHIVKKLVQKQLENWEQFKADKFINKRRLKIYALLAGCLVWEASDTSVNCCEDLDWRRALSLHLWYHCNPTANIPIVISEYDKAFQGNNSCGKYAQPPLPPYLESISDHDLLLEPIHDGSSNECDQKLTLYDTCYHLLKLYCDRSYRLDKLLVPTTSTPAILDYRLSWLLNQILISLGYTHLPLHATSALHCSFASQLESVGLWQWAAFVLLHITDSFRRQALVKELLLRHITLNDDDDESQSRENFLLDRLKVPKEWIFQTKATKAHSLGRTADEAWYLLKAGCWSRSHDIIINHLAADAIINENYDYLKDFLEHLAAAEKSSTILDWSIGGQVFLDYIRISQTVDKVIKGDINAYDLEKLQPEVVSVCHRLSSIRCPTARARLCQSEMAKKTATLLRAVLTLQKARISHTEPTYLLATNLSSLPMPEDYALQELQAMARSYMLAFTSE